MCNRNGVTITQPAANQCFKVRGGLTTAIIVPRRANNKREINDTRRQNINIKEYGTKPCIKQILARRRNPLIFYLQYCTWHKWILKWQQAQEGYVTIARGDIILIIKVFIGAFQCFSHELYVPK